MLLSEDMIESDESKTVLNVSGFQSRCDNRKPGLATTSYPSLLQNHTGITATEYYEHVLPTLEAATQHYRGGRPCIALCVLGTTLGIAGAVIAGTTPSEDVLGWLLSRVLIISAVVLYGTAIFFMTQDGQMDSIVKRACEGLSTQFASKGASFELLCLKPSSIYALRNRRFIVIHHCAQAESGSAPEQDFGTTHIVVGVPVAPRFG